MYILLIVVHIIVSIVLVMIVLLQTGKGADMGAAFGGASQTLFGGAGPAPLLGKVTTGAAVIFMITSLALAYMSANPSAGSMVNRPVPAQSAPAPAQPQEMPE
jgi:preprotein translocase subunit SecG